MAYECRKVCGEIAATTSAGKPARSATPRTLAPLAHANPTVTLIDRELFRFAEIWAAAGHPNGVFMLTPAELVALRAAPVADVVVDVPAAP